MIRDCCGTPDDRRAPSPHAPGCRYGGGSPAPSGGPFPLRGPSPAILAQLALARDAGREAAYAARSGDYARRAHWESFALQVLAPRRDARAAYDAGWREAMSGEVPPMA